MGIDDFKRSYPLRTVCEVTREVFDIINAHRAKIGEVVYAEIFAKLQEMMRMQKKMDLRLKEYKSTYEVEMYAKNEDHSQDEDRRASASL